MKYWRGFLVAGILAVISWALVQFAQTHSVLIDMVYPYMTRLIITSLSQWSSGISVCLWQVLLLLLIGGGIASIVLMIVLKWHPVQWLGWVLAVISCISLFSTVLYGLNAYTGPLAEDIRLTMTDYTVSELSEATAYYRDKANALSGEVGDKMTQHSFEELAVMAADGFTSLTYDQAISLFAGSTVPVKKLGWAGSYTLKKESGVTVALTGEAAVNPDTPAIAMPFAMCKEMAKRMTISREEEAKYAAYMACIANPSIEFQYSGYSIAYYHCYKTLAAIPTTTAQAAAKELQAQATERLRHDMEQYEDFFGSYSEPSGDSFPDLLACWYIQEFIPPLHEQEEDPFNPKDPSKVDLTYKEPEVAPMVKEDKK